MLKKQKQIEINSEVLYKISLSLLDHYYIEPTLHFFLLLSYLTVKEFSKNNQHLDKNAKLDLCMKYTPDLLTGLGQSNIITVKEATEMREKFLENQVDMKNIIEACVIIFNYKDDKIIKTNKCCLR